MSKHLYFLLLSLAVLPLFAVRQPYERYQSIVDRQMFGQVPEGFDPTKPPSEVQKTTSREQKELTKEQEKIKSAIRFSAINITPSGETAVGFSDSSDPKNVRHYYLKVGETRDGWEVKEADPIKATMTIVKGDISLDLTLGANSAQGGGNASRIPAQQPGGNRPGSRNLSAFGQPRQIGSGLIGGSLRERRMARQQQREEAQRAAEEDKAKAKADAEAKAKAEAEEKAQREQEREDQRKQLLQIQEELKKAREARETAEAAKSEEKADSDAESPSDE